MLKDRDEAAMSREQAQDQKPKSFLPAWVYIIALVAIVFYGFASYNKHTTLKELAEKCTITFKNPARCECIASELKARTSTIYFMPVLRRFTAPTLHRLEDVIRESAMVCVQPEK
jgi:hypothetical protein